MTTRKQPRNQSRKPNSVGSQARAPLDRAEDMFAGRYPPRPDAGPYEIVDPRWLLKAAGIAIIAALLCSYATLCLLVYQGQWQLLLHPESSPALSGLLLDQSIHFGAAETGQPQLVGLWLPAADSSPATPTILYLPDGSGSLARDTSALAHLHTLPVNLFAFDYRGFGASAPSPPHPSEARMTEDAEMAFDYLVNTRHISSTSVVPYGVGLGASLAAGLAHRHASIPALIVESPLPHAAEAALHDSRARVVPLHLFLHEHFDITGPLSGLRTPKLLLEAGPSYSPDMPAMRDFNGLVKAAASPSIAVHLSPGRTADPAIGKAWRESILRFLDEYLHLLWQGARL